MAKKQQKRKVTQPQVEEQQELMIQEAEMLERIKKKVRVGLEHQKLEHYGYKVSFEAFCQMNSWLELTAMQWEKLMDFVIGEMPSAISELNGIYVFHTAQKDGTFRLIPKTAKKNKQIWVETPELMQKFEKIENKGYKLIYEKEQTRTIWMKPDGETIAVGLKLVNGNRSLCIAFYVKNIIANSLRNEDLAERLLSLKWDKDLYKSLCSVMREDEAKGVVDVEFSNNFANVLNEFIPAVTDFWVMSKSKEEKFVLQKKENGIDFHRANGNSLYYDDFRSTINIERTNIDFSDLENQEDIAVTLSAYVKELSRNDKV